MPGDTAAFGRFEETNSIRIIAKQIEAGPRKSRPLSGAGGGRGGSRSHRIVNQQVNGEGA
jgi:hypothetical protein